jgi:hypothetical protein
MAFDYAVLGDSAEILAPVFAHIWPLTRALAGFFAGKPMIRRANMRPTLEAPIENDAHGEDREHHRHNEHSQGDSHTWLEVSSCLSVSFNLAGKALLS